MNTAATSTSNSQSTAAGRAGTRTWGQWLYTVRWPSIVFGVILLLLLGFIYFQTTLVTGRELNARTWELRQFSFRRDPFTNFQFSGVRHRPAPEIAAWVNAGDFNPLQVTPSVRVHLTRSKQMDDRWDLIDFNIQGTNSTGDALILVNLLSARDPQYDEFWPGWSTDNPKRAAVLWPAAQDLVRCESYSQLPDLLELALSTKTDSEFDVSIDEFMVQALLNQCKLLLDANKRNTAIVVARIALNYGEHAELKEIAESNR